MFKSVILYTSKLVEMKDFYHTQLALPMIENDATFFTLRIGTSTLTFKESEEDATYHFAFNLPGNQLPSAKRWLSDRVSLNIEDGHDEVYYKSFNADAIYFNDPAGNVVEYIGRRTVQVEEAFTVQSIINISEISVTTPFVLTVGKQLKKLGIPARNNKPLIDDGLNFLGREDTYIVLVPPKRRWYFSDMMSMTCPLTIIFTNNREVIVTKDGQLIFHHE